MQREREGKGEREDRDRESKGERDRKRERGKEGRNMRRDAGIVMTNGSSSLMDRGGKKKETQDKRKR